MNHLSQITSPSDEIIEMTYICLAEVEALVDRLSYSENNWFDRGNLNVLLAITNYLNLKQLRAILADLSELEIEHGVGSERSQSIRSALNADKLHLYGALDTDCSNRSREMEDAA